jgi:glycosyltransferase involved in cell wall biosynthesis
MHSPLVDIVLPCYNPPTGWSRNIVDNVQYLESEFPGVGIQLILVNDGSAKGIAQSDLDLLQASLPGFRYVSYETNRGKGFALRQGIAQSTAGCCMYTDIDFPFTRESTTRFLQKLLTGEMDVLAGMRDESYYAQTPWLRKVISRFLKFLVKTFLGLKHVDTQCGIKGMNAQGRELFLDTTIDRYLFDLEFIYHASKSKTIRLQSAGVQLRPGIVFSKMPVSILWPEVKNFFRIFFQRKSDS